MIARAVRDNAAMLDVLAGAAPGGFVHRRTACASLCDRGLPLGIQCVAAWGREDLLLRVASQLG